MTDIITFADVTFGNLTEARFVCDRTPEDARAHPARSLHAGFYSVLVEDLPITGARELFAGLAELRSAAALEFPDVPNWRDIRTGSRQAWRAFADAHSVAYPTDATPQRIAVNVRSWLEKNR